MKHWSTTERDGIPNWLMLLAVGTLALLVGVIVFGVVYLAQFLLEAR